MLLFSRHVLSCLGSCDDFFFFWELLRLKNLFKTLKIEMDITFAYADITIELALWTNSYCLWTYMLYGPIGLCLDLDLHDELI